MKYLVWATTALMASTAMTQAGGIERSQQSVGILFEEGNYVELSYSFVEPDVSGETVFAVPPGPGPIPAGQNSRNMAGVYPNLAFSFKTAITENLDVALVLDSPFGADVSYPAPGAPPNAYLYGGSTAEINTQALTLMARYRFENNFSILGGVRALSSVGTVALFNGYTMEADGGTELGYLLGVAYERPDIALRVALTYNSAITHTYNALETPALIPTTFETTMPQSVNLEFQSGIAADTLLFGSIRWVDWSEFDISPFVYVNNPGNPLGDALVDYDNDTITYQIGVGRRFTENWSGAATLTHEPSTGGFSGNLGPTDGRTAVGLAASWTNGMIEITGGVQYSWIGDATTETPAALTGGVEGVPFANFQDNTTTAAGIRIGYSF